MQIYIGLGSNLGDRETHLERAIQAISQMPGTRIEKISSRYETEPWGEKEQPHFLNQVLLVETKATARDFFLMCQQTEKQLGREKPFKWGPRIIDIDILMADDQILNEGDLILPHPRLLDRKFVLLPLAEIAPRITIPGSGMESRQALANCPDQGEVVAV